MKKIGLVDYCLSGQYDDYPKRIKEANDAANETERYKISYVWSELKVSPTDGATSAQWCEENCAMLCDSIEELCEKSDCIIILSSMKPEKHLDYAEKVFPYGKNTFISAPLAPDYETAVKIFDLADKYGTKVFSASVLRFAEGVKRSKGNMIIVTGGGADFDKSVFRMIEAAMAIVGRGADYLFIDAGDDTEADKCGYGVKIHYPDNRMAALVYAPRLGSEIITNDKKMPMCDEYPDNLSFEILKFFDSGEFPFNPRESLEAVRIAERVVNGKLTTGRWIPLWNGDEILP